MIYQYFSKSTSIVAYILSLLLLVGFIFFIDSNFFNFYTLLSIVLVFLINYVFNQNLIRNKTIGVSNYLPQFIITCILLYVQIGIETINTITSILLLVIAVNKIIDLYNVKTERTKIFEVGLLLGLTVLFNPLFWTSILLGVIGVTWVKTVRIKDYIALLLGFLLPVFLKATFYKLKSNSITEFISSHFQFDISFLLKFNNFQLSFVLIIMFFLVVMIVTNFRKLDQQIVKNRIYFRLWLFFLIIIGTTVLFQKGKNIFDQLLIVLSIPISLMLSIVSFNKRKALLINCLIFLTIVLSIFFNQKF